MTLEIISLIYKSIDYLNFIEDQMLRYCQDFDDVKVSCRIVANDASQTVLDKLYRGNIPYTIYNDPKPNDYYLNRVYRCWNFCATSSNSDCVCFINSDMTFSKEWLKPLMDLHKNNYLPVPRLVESGKIKSGTYGVSQNFGRSPTEFCEVAWLNFANNISQPEYKSGGLYMPVIFDKNEFILAGMYPEGNVLGNEIGSKAYEAIGADKVFFKKFTDLTNRKHVTAFNSLAYHIQEGEMDSI